MQQKGQRWPERKHDLLYTSMCLLGRLNQVELAIAQLKEALDMGHWYGPGMLAEDDEDLVNLLAHPEFRELREVSLRRQQEAQASTRPGPFTCAPESQNGATPLLIALHGNTGHGADTLNTWSPAVSLGWFVASAQSTQITGPNQYIWDDFAIAENEVKQHYASLTADGKFDTNRVVIGGFSMGAGFSVLVALKQMIAVRGFLAVSLYIGDPEALAPDIEALKGSGVRGYILMGDQDHPCLPGARAVANMMQAAGLDCTYDLRPGMTHVYPPDFGDTLQRAPEFITAG